MSTQNLDSNAEDQAALWAARLDGSTLTTADRAELNAWLQEKPEHRALLSEYCQLSADLEEQLPVLVATGGAELPAEKPKANRSRRVFTVLVGSFSLAAAAALAVAFWPHGRDEAVRNIASTVAHRSSATLPDGTRVELNARTNLVVEQTGSERHVRLASGEAFFSVTKDKSRPFIVETPAGSVRVTGTSFNVRSELPSQLEVTVVEGSVQVRPSNNAGSGSSAPYALTPGDHLTTGKDGVSVKTLSAGDLENALAWRQGQIVFDRVPLGDALSRFAHYHGIGISATADVAALNVGGRYSLDDLDGFFSAIEEILPVNISHDSSGTFRVSHR